jgi:hypothetical protein
MARDETRARSPTLILRGESKRILSSADVAERVENFVATSEGTLRSVRGPCRLIPDRIAMVRDQDGITSYVSRNAGDYGNMHGVFHALLMKGTRDALIVHTGKEVRVFRGMGSPTWDILIGPASSDPLYEYELTDDTRPQFPTQFEATSTGVVIVPQNYQRAFFYDGEKILPLGYSTPPSPPSPKGPTSSDDTEVDGSKTNDQGFAVSRMNAGYTINKKYGFGRIGSIAPSIDIDKGNYLLEGRWQYATQWIDAFGNMSPVSNRSNPVKVDRQLAPGTTKNTHTTQKLKKWFNVTGIAKGRKGTVGRILYRTRDTENSGTVKLFQVPGNIGFGTFGLFATVPDNRCRSFTDNNSDGSLVLEEEHLLPVPNFQLCRAAFGRLFIANLSEEPGALMYSLPNKFGTFPRAGKMYPDPSGGEITALWAGSAGLLCFTQSSTFLVSPNDTGEGFKSQPVNMNIGCVAPSSLANFPDNSAVWLGKEGFYRAGPDGNTTLISTPIQQTIDRINRSYVKGACALYDTDSKEYRCWIPVDSSTENNLCLIFDGENWRTRNTEVATSACTTQDERSLSLIAGKAPQLRYYKQALVGVEAEAAEKGVFILDRENTDFAGNEMANHVIETSWIDYQRSDKRKSTKSIYLGLRERYYGTAKISVMRDYRKVPTVYEDNLNGNLYKEEDPPAIWGKSRSPMYTPTFPSTFEPDEQVDVPYDSLDGEVRDQRIVKPRPYWKKIDVAVGSCEVYKIRIETPYPVEFIGIIVEEEPKVSISARTS